jgi:DNA-directed RNA polymerase specialized sigma24 family protein
MSDRTSSATSELERYRNYLCLLARRHLDPRLRWKFGASDLIQQTLPEACKGLPDFRGRTAAELAAWLRRSLANAERALRRQARDVNRERSLEEELAASSCRLGDLVVVEQPSPSDVAIRIEHAVRVADKVGASSCSTPGPVPEKPTRVALARWVDMILFGAFEVIAEQETKSKV